MQPIGWPNDFRTELPLYQRGAGRKESVAAAFSDSSNGGSDVLCENELDVYSGEESVPTTNYI